MITIQIPTTLGGFAHLAKLMPQLSQEAKENNAEIIIIDNASKDGTMQYLSNYDLTVIVNKTNLGFAKAHNQASRIAQGEYLLLLNNDTVVPLGTLKILEETFSLDKNIGIVGCSIMKMDTHEIQHAGVMFTPDYVPYELGLKTGISAGIPKNDPRVRSVREVPSVTGACMMIKKDLFKQLGGFDERYKNGWEDTDLVLRARELGYTVWYNGKAQILHKHFGSMSVGRFAFEAENRKLYDSIWVTTNRAKDVLKGFING